MSLLIPVVKSGPKGSPVGRVLSIAYQRNGMGGTGFYTVHFQPRGSRTEPALFAVLPTSGDGLSGEAFVFDPADLSNGFCGTDIYGADLVTVCNAAKWPHEMGKTAQN